MPIDTTTVCPSCQTETSAVSSKCRHCAEWLPVGPPVHAAALAPAPAAPKASSSNKAAIVVAAVLVGFIALLMLSLVAITFLGAKSEPKFQRLDSELNAVP